MIGCTRNSKKALRKTVRPVSAIAYMLGPATLGSGVDRPYRSIAFKRKDRVAGLGALQSLVGSLCFSEVCASRGWWASASAHVPRSRHEWRALLLYFPDALAHQPRLGTASSLPRPQRQQPLPERTAARRSACCFWALRRPGRCLPRMTGKRIREVKEESAPCTARSGDMSGCACPSASARADLRSQRPKGSKAPQTTPQLRATPSRRTRGRLDAQCGQPA